MSDVSPQLRSVVAAPVPCPAADKHGDYEFWAGVQLRREPRPGPIDAIDASDSVMVHVPNRPTLGDPPDRRRAT